MDRGAWKAAVHGVTEGQTRLSDFTFTFHFHALEKEMATQSSILAWRIPGTGEPSGLPSMGSNSVGHDWRDLAAAAAAVFTKNLCVYIHKNIGLWFFSCVVFFGLVWYQGNNGLIKWSRRIIFLGVSQVALAVKNLPASAREVSAECYGRRVDRREWCQ